MVEKLRRILYLLSRFGGGERNSLNIFSLCPVRLQCSWEELKSKKNSQAAKKKSLTATDASHATGDMPVHRFKKPYYIILQREALLFITQLGMRPCLYRATRNPSAGAGGAYPLSLVKHLEEGKPSHLEVVSEIQPGGRSTW